MSLQEESPRPTSPLTPKSEAKPRPEVPRKPSTQSSSPPLEHRGSGASISGGKVRRIVDRFSKQGAATGEQHHSSRIAKSAQRKHFKRAPSTKPKPARASLQIEIGGERAPPLPLKRHRTLLKQKEILGGEEGESINVQGGRSGKVLFHLSTHVQF